MKIKNWEIGPSGVASWGESDVRATASLVDVEDDGKPIEVLMIETTQRGVYAIPVAVLRELLHRRGYDLIWAGGAER